MSPDPMPSSAPTSWPLNDAQRVVWLDLRLRAHPLAYQLGGQARLHGLLDTQRFQAAVAQAMAAHDALRLRIDPREPRQHLAPADTPPPLRWHRLDEAGVDGTEGIESDSPEARLAALTRRIHAEALGLDGGPLFAIDAVRVRADQWVLVWRCSHLIADGYAVWLKVKAIVAAYRALGGTGEAPRGSSFLATLGSEAPAASRTEADRAHWRERLADPPAPVFEAREASAAAGPDADTETAARWALKGADYRRWNTACARDGLSPHRVLLALMALAVGTRLNRDDLIVGLALHGRTRATREVVGMFSGVLPVRCRWSAREDRLIDAVRRSALALERDVRHRRLPVDEIGRQLGRAVQGRARLFDLSLSYLPVDDDAIHLDFGDAQAVVERQYPGAIVPLPLDVMDHAREERLEFSLGHDPSFLDAAQAQGLAEALQRAMQAWMEDAGQPVRALSPVSPTERELLLGAFQPAWRGEFPLDRALHALVREQARAQPQAVAVEEGERRLSYAQLDALSEALAGRLRAAWPTGRAEPVAAVALPRSMETVVALLATLKAGGVYLPLDIAHPLPRLQYQLDDARADVLIDALDLGLDGARPSTGPALPGAERVRRLDDTPLAPVPSAAPDETAFDPQRLAYLIYTSGSTGQPKPVGVSHRAAVNLAWARQGHDPIGPGDRILAAISVGFDVSIGQLLLPLLSGATIVIAPPLQRLEPEAFWALLARHGVTHINSVPSFFDTVSEALMARPPEARYRGLRRLMLGGEALTGALATRLQQRLPGTALVNMYGPTETCIDATAYPVPAADTLPGGLPSALPIGRPLPNYRAYVLDAADRLLPPGVAGELCLGGAGVARGYIGRDALTAEKFGDDPHADPAQPPCDRRLYRSGDVARWRADGQIEFLGRNDQQVKIRGHRIETGEIEAALLRQRDVQQAAVIALPDARGELQLAAYLVAAPGAALDLAALRPALAHDLPGHMLPASLQSIDALPLTPNGKLDRKALPAPQFEAPQRGAVEAPQGPLESLLATLWSELLGVSPIGRDDHFFDLGGHSLLALKLVDRLRQAGWQAEVSALFAEPTLKALAAACRPAPAPQDSTATAPAGLPTGCTHITPELLDGLALSPAQIDSIVAQGPGRAEAVQDIVALAPLQQGMLYHHLMQAEGDVFLSPFIVAFPDEARLERFLALLQRVIDRHDILRTGVVWEGLPEAVQVVWREARLPVEDLGRAPAGEALARLQAHVDPRRLRIDLRRPPLLRAVRLREDGQRPLLALVLHHLALDHGAMEIVLAEVAALAADAQAPLPPSLPLRAVVAPCRRPGAAEAAVRHFRAELGDLDQPTTPYGLATLPTDDETLQDHHLDLPPATVTALRRQAAGAGVGLASLLHLAYALVLARTSGRDDLVFGTVLLGQLGPSGSSGTPALAGARALGMMINTLPLRLRLSPATPLRAALQATQAALAALMPHEHTPLAQAQRCSAVEAPAPLFTALFNVRHRLAPSAGTGPLGLELVWAHERTGYPLAMAVDLSSDAAGDALRLSTQAVAPADPAQVNALMAQALQALLGPLEEPLSALDVLPAAERQRLLHDFQPATPPVAAVGLHTAVQAQAQRTPAAPAVIDGERVLSYRELDAQAEGLSARLRRALALAAPGVSEPVVAVALPRSADTVVALLAILKAGAVYLPLDIAYPAQRLQFMLDDAQARLLIDDPSHPATAALQARRLDAEAEADDADARPSPPPPADDPERLAYIIYTSGSTGRPKAVGVPHRAGVNLAQARMGHDPIGPGDRILAAISVGFDVSIGQLLLPLLSGATVVIAPPLQGLGPEAFWDLLARHGVTHINSVPSFFDAVSEALPGLPEARRYRGLKRLMLGGEVLSGALARKLQQRLPGTGLVNMYGPTEACIDATAYPVPEGGEGSVALPSSLPIGRPLPNYRAYVLDAHGRLAPVGVAGELCLAGAGLARGYVGQPEATAEKFVPDPHAQGTPFAEGRMYRTGDHARWRADGQIEFLGRRDEQVKIRGHRVETGEIEAVLLQDPALRQAAVRPCRDGDRPGWAFLAAYLVAAGTERPDDEALRRRLAAALPEHMIPLAWIWLEALPITPNGKLDAKALPAPTATRAASGREAVAPRSPLEACLLAVWHQAFERTDFGVTDNFFELGGQSLRAMRLLTACQAALREDGARPAWAEASHRLSLRQLLQAPTVEGLAAQIEPPADGAGVSAGPELPLAPLRSGGSATPLYAVHPQGGHVLCFAALARHLPAGIPMFGLQAPGLEPGETPLDTVPALAAHHVAAIQAWQPQGPVRLLGYSAGGVIAHEMARQLLQAGRKVTMLVLVDAPVPGQLPTTGTPGDDDALQRELEGVWARLQASDAADAATAPSPDPALAARILATSRAMAQALRGHRASPLPLDLHLVRALRRDDPLPDWQPLVGPPARLHHLDVDADHHHILDDEPAAQVAGWIRPSLLTG